MGASSVAPGNVQQVACICVEVCRMGIVDRNRLAKSRDETIWCLGAEHKSYFWAVHWVKFGKGYLCQNLYCVVREFGLNSESNGKPL